MRRFASVWLPRWPIDRLKAQQRNPAVGPFALIHTAANTTRLTAANTVAVRMGLTVGMTLADAMALVPALVTAPADFQGDAAALERVADWCGRYSPWVAVDDHNSLVLDITGVPHLFGGEEAMLSQMQQAFRRRQVQSRLAIADTPAAAWAWSHYGPCGVLPSRPHSIEPLSDLPVKALRIAPAIAETLATLGLKTVGDIANRPRAPFAKRFGPDLLTRLDCLFARQDEPISPRQTPAPWRSRADLAEPISTREAIDKVVADLLVALCQLLEQEQLGARQLALHAYRVDGDVQTLRIGTAMPNRSPKHLARLFREPLDGIMPGFGFEAFILEAISADPFTAEQAHLETATYTGPGFAQLVDRLQARLGTRAVFRYEPVNRHSPEHSFVRVSPLAKATGEMPEEEPRPSRLFQPEPIQLEANADAFTWRRIRRRIAAAIGPERLHGEWMHDGMDVAARDYYRIEDEIGHCYWIFRSQGGWFIHGIFV